MNNLYLLITITMREYGKKYADFFHRHSVNTILSTICNGTAQQNTLDYFGLEKTEKLMFFSVTSSDGAKKILHDLIYDMQIDIPGSGISMSVPLESISAVGMRCMTDGQEIIIGEEKNAMEDFQYSLIITIAEKGNAELVMEAARSADAKGGTVVHAKGMGAAGMEKFFGVSIAAEKEMLYIVVKSRDKAAVMKSIMRDAGADSPAKSIIFSLPVDSVVGLRSLTDDAR